MDTEEEDKDYDEYEHLHGNYYETRSVSSGRQDYWCEECGKDIPKGTPSETHHFYPEFENVRTHPECSDAFLAKIKPDER